MLSVIWDPIYRTCQLIHNIHFVFPFWIMVGLKTTRLTFYNTKGNSNISIVKDYDVLVVSIWRQLENIAPLLAKN